MRELTLKQMQEIELGILKYIRDICDEYNINYYLAYGTLLGAVRHQGFIPWDDDVDIWMPREDFTKFMNVIKENPHPVYELVCFEMDSRFTAPLPKVIDNRTRLCQNYAFIEKVELGVYVDIFILDGVGDDISTANANYNKSMEIYKKWFRADTKMFPPGKKKFGSFLRWVRNLRYKARGIPYFLEKLIQNNSRYSFYDSDYVAALNAGTPDANSALFENKLFGQESELIFENEEFRVPSDYEVILKSCYGNYRELPPEEKRVSHHCYTVNWK